MKLEVFFDYACPYCKQGHEYLLELLPQNPEVEVIWRPCEAHPRPERYGLHSDLCARGMYIITEHGVDLEEYHKKMYQAALTDKQNIEDVTVLADVIDGFMNAEVFQNALNAGAYSDELDANNRAAWSDYGFHAVPSLVMGKKILRSVENIGLTSEMIRRFLQSDET